MMKEQQWARRGTAQVNAPYVITPNVASCRLLRNYVWSSIFTLPAGFDYSYYYLKENARFWWFNGGKRLALMLICSSCLCFVFDLFLLRNDMSRKGVRDARYRSLGQWIVTSFIPVSSSQKCYSCWFYHTGNSPSKSVFKCSTIYLVFNSLIVLFEIIPFLK